MVKKRELDPIHDLRSRYNAVVRRLHDIDLKTVPSHRHWEILELVKKYPMVATDMGKVCQICGMNDFERHILYNVYHGIIIELEWFLKKYIDNQE